MAQDENEYILEGDKEAERLRQNHEIIKYFMGGQLIRAPLDASGNTELKILDSGTSDGTWIFDVRETLPSNTTFVGTDISTERLPKHPPERTSFEIQDILKLWPAHYQSSFDLVHQRLVLAGTGPSGKSVVQNLCALVKTGGWIQLVEVDNVCADDDGPAHKQWVRMMVAVFETFGAEKGKSYAWGMKEWIEGAGFVNVQEEKVDYYVGRKVEDERLRDMGVVSLSTATTALIGYVMSIRDSLPEDVTKDLETLIERWRKEMYEQGGYYPIRVVWGQRPKLV